MRPGHRAGGGGERERRFNVKKGELGERPEPEEAAGWVLLLQRVIGSERMIRWRRGC